MLFTGFSFSRCLIAAGSFFLLSSAIFASTYPPEGLKTEFTQPDGTTLKLRVFGGLYYAETRTEDDRTVAFNPADRAYYYAEKNSSGNLVPGTVPASNKSPATLSQAPGLKADKSVVSDTAKKSFAKYNDNAAFVKRGKKAAAAKSSLNADNGAMPSPPSHTTTGVYKGLCVLINFKDLEGAYTRAQILDYCNKTGYNEFDNTGSVKDYYFDQSNRQLTYTNIVSRYVTLTFNKSHYNVLTRDSGFCGRDLVADAIAELKKAGFDFSQVSADDDGNIYAANFFFAGQDSGVWAKGLWPHRWHLDAPLEVEDGKFVYDYQVTNMGSGDSLAVGTFIHENGHMLCGYTDYYDYGYESDGLGYHCLMSGGDHLNDGKTPGPMSAYLKWKSGWIAPTEIQAATPGIYDVAAQNTQSYVIKKNAREYFVIENRVKDEKWSKFLPDAGLAVWHVDEAKDGNDEQDMTAARHYECSLVQADGRFDLERSQGLNGDNTDYFKENGRLTDNTAPHAKWWDGTVSRIVLSDISAPAPVMSFRIANAVKLAMGKAGEGSIDPPEGVSVRAKNSVAALTAQPAANWRFSHWSVSGGAAVANANSASTTVTLASDGSACANFTRIPRRLTMAKTGQGETMPAAGGYDIYQGVYFDIVARPAENYYFHEWERSGGAYVSNVAEAQTTAILVADGSITACFARIMRNLSIEVSGDGTTSPPPGPTPLYQGVSYNIKAAPDENSRFVSWTCSGGVSVGGKSVAETTFSLSADGTLTANFERIPRKLTMSVSGSGITVPAPGTATVGQGVVFDIAAMAEANWRFSSWKVSGGAVVENTKFSSTRAMLNASGGIEAVFLRVQHNLTMKAAGGGSVSPDGGYVNQNETFIIKASPAANWRFSEWTVSGGASIANRSASATTASLSSAATVTAVFTPLRQAGDFSGDGRSDLLLRGVSGGLQMRFMKGGVVTASPDFALDSGFVPVAFGDFNGDGFSDIIARHSDSGDLKMFLMSGASVISSGVLVSGAPDLKIAGTGDLDGDGKTDIIWRNSVTGVTTGNLMNGLASAGQALIYDGSDPGWRVAGLGDLNGDGMADIVWRHTGTGAVIAYLMRGLSMTSWGLIYDGSDPGWRVVGLGDINGDGMADIVWRHAGAGAVIAYLMNGVSMISWTLIYDGSDRSQRPVSLGDYNGDGKIDITMRNGDTGDVTIYFMDGLTVTSRETVLSGGLAWTVLGEPEAAAAVLTMSVSGPGSVTPGPGAHTVRAGEALRISAAASPGAVFRGWTVAGDAVVAFPSLAESPVTLEGAALVTANFAFSSSNRKSDFNGDRKSDLLWRNTANGQTAMWLMNGASSLDARIIFDSDPTWVPVGKADFDADGKADIIWQRSGSGAVVMWFMDGVGTKGTAWVRETSADTVAGVGDFNGDGFADILWRSPAGAVSMTLQRGAAVIDSRRIFDAGTTWAPSGTGDFNGDGFCDILWTEAATGNVAMWLMRGLDMTDGRLIFQGDGLWSPASCGDFNGDGKCDIAWLSAGGQAAVWLMDGFATLSSGYIYQGGDTAWKIVDSGDCDGDGKTDIIWRNTGSGQVIVYFMDGAVIKGWTVIFQGDPSWTVIR